MENRLYHLMKICLSLLLFSTITGCIKDDLSDCPSKTYRLIIKTDARDYVAPEGIKDAILFLFDGNNRFVDVLSVLPDKIIELNYPQYTTLKAVVWANTASGLQNISPAVSSLFLYNASIQLLDSDERPQNGFAKSPDDLFHGIKELDMHKNTNNQPDILTIKRKVAAITITARHLKEYAGLITTSANSSSKYALADNTYSYEVRSGKNTIDFYGNLLGKSKKYLPHCSFNNKDELYAPAFFVLPSALDSYTEVDIYKGNTLVHTISTDQNERPIQTEEGKIIDLIVEFGSDIKVVISIKEWDKINVSEEF